MSRDILMPERFPVTAHSDFVSKDGIFVSIKGTQQDGALFIPEALSKGAKHIIADERCSIDKDLRQLIKKHDASLEIVTDARKALAIKSAHAAGDPATKLTLVGVTGTKGKTTTCFLLEHMLKTGYKTALLSSAGNKILEAPMPTKLSAPQATPQADYLHQFLALCVKNEVTHVVIEVAAQALSTDRMFGIFFDAVIFTNFGLEHLEFYKNMDEYFNAKSSLLAMRKPNAPAVVFADETIEKKLIKNFSNVITFGTKKSHNFCIEFSPIESNNALRIDFFLNQFHYYTKTIGVFNVFNIAASAIVSYRFAIAEAQIQQALISFPGVPGRGELHQLKNGALCVIDYAHNPLSYQAILSALRLKTTELIVVFGAGGQRDPSRRPLMGKIAAEFADVIFLTTDNCRFEDPNLIIQHILTGISSSDRKKVFIELDRAIAITMAYKKASIGTIIALLGKGPDCYQLVNGVKTYFNDLEVILSL